MKDILSATVQKLEWSNAKTSAFFFAVLCYILSMFFFVVCFDNKRKLFSVYDFDLLASEVYACQSILFDVSALGCVHSFAQNPSNSVYGQFSNVRMHTAVGLAIQIWMVEVVLKT